MERAPTPEDYESIDRAIESLERRGWRRFGLNEAIDGWADLVMTLEAGEYGFGEEFANDVSVRTWLHELRPLLSSVVRAAVDRQLTPLDERFRLVTTPSPGHTGDLWWVARVPAGPNGPITA